MGTGAGVFDRLKEHPDVSSWVFGVNVASKPRNEEDYLNIRIQSWVNVRNWLRDAILEKHEGFYQLAYPKYKITSNGDTPINLRLQRGLRRR